jgi:hypothetical protein
MDEFKARVNLFKSAYDEMEVGNMSVSGCKVKEKASVVTGTYRLTATMGKETQILSGQWNVFFEFMEQYGFWYIVAVDMEGIDF